MPLDGPRIATRSYWLIAPRAPVDDPLVAQFCAWLQAQSNTGA